MTADQDILLDLDRRRRLGLVEAVWGEHKSDEQIARCLEQLHAAGEQALVTRFAPEREPGLRRLTALPFRLHREARALTLPDPPPPDPALGLVAVVGAGSSDRAVAQEACLALACHQVASDLVLDIGVAGLHRLLARLERLRQARVVIVCAGMEGALPTVLAGLLPQPLIGVPVSVGYGVSAGGQAALQGMLASCAPGLGVVNIDNGYGAAMAALRIVRAGRGALSGSGEAPSGGPTAAPTTEPTTTITAAPTKGSADAPAQKGRQVFSPVEP